MLNRTKSLRMQIALLVFLMLTTACNNPPNSNQNPLEVLDKPVNIEMIDTVSHGVMRMPWSVFRKKYRYISIVYLQDGCAPCYPNFLNWHKRMEQIKKADDYTVLFVINARDYNSFSRDIRLNEEIDELYYYFIDPRNEFFRYNSDISRPFLDRSLLIDKDNHIKMVGEPFANADMTKVFHIVTGVDIQQTVESK